MKQKLTELKWETDNSTLIVGDFNTLLTIMDKTRQKINKKTEDMNTKNQTDLPDTYIKPHSSTTIEYKFFSTAHGAFSRKDHKLGHKMDHNKFQRTEIKYMLQLKLDELKTSNPLVAWKVKNHL